MGAGFIKVNVKGVKDLVSRCERMPELVREALIREVTDLTLKLYANVQRRAGGDVVNVKTGRYLRSIRPSVRAGSFRVTGKVRAGVGLSSKNKVNRIPGFLEFGGHAKPRDIPVRNKKALHFLRGGAEIFAKVAHHPGPTIAPHPLVFGAFDQMHAEILEGLTAAATVETR